MKTTAQKQAEKRLAARIKGMTTEELKQTAIALMNITSEGSTLVFVFVTNELDERLTEDEQVKFYEMLDEC